MNANEFITKQERIHALLGANNLNALMLRRSSSFAWATCGASSFISMASTEAVARVEAAFIGATRPGRALREVFADGLAAYAAEGYGQEWRLYHQGGAAGYEPRVFLGTPYERSRW